MHPSFSGWLVTCAYLAQTTLPPCVTIPNSLTFTSIIVPLVITPREVYICDEGFFLTPNDWQAEGGLQFGMGHMCLVEPEAHRSDEPLELRRLSRKILADESHFGDHSFPTLSPRLPRVHHLERLGVADRAHFRQGNVVFASFFLAFLFYGVGEDRAGGLLLAVEQVRGNRSLGRLIHGALLLFFLVLLDQFAHLHLL